MEAGVNEGGLDIGSVLAEAGYRRWTKSGFFPPGLKHLIECFSDFPDFNEATAFEKNLR